MLDRLLSIIALAALLGFLGILAWKVPRLDLGLVIAITVLLVAYDLIIHSRRKARPGSQKPSR